MVVRSAERLRLAEEVVAQLRDGLGVVAVRLPSLRVDLVSMASEDPDPLVDLGRCNLDTAMRLAIALQGLKP
ncbi:hypothetical protein ABCR94_01560 [Streptomyces sp. 21So2-11]|uniref:hypothetical protein n=1 Tax=Streptomyces sp. 21So2-11 TaxID=3144408 RepID=UPI00321B62CE